MKKTKNNYVIAIIGNKKDLQKNEKELNDNNNNISGIEGGKILSILNKTIFYTTTAKDYKDLKMLLELL